MNKSDSNDYLLRVGKKDYRRNRQQIWRRLSLFAERPDRQFEIVSDTQIELSTDPVTNPLEINSNIPKLISGHVNKHKSPISEMYIWGGGS